MKIIPAIDIIGGKCVRLEQGNYNTKVEYSASPLEMAKQYEAHGIEYLHLVDLDGAKAKKVTNWKVLEQICSQTNLKVDFSGGIRSESDVEAVLNAGVNQVMCGSIAYRQPAKFMLWLNKFGTNKMILSADCMNNKIAVHGWQESTEMNIIDFIKQFYPKLNYVLSTDIEKDGLLQGPSFELYQNIQKSFSDINIIASGGVSCLKDLEQLQSTNIYGVVIGKAIYENRIDLKSLEKFALC